VRIRLQTIVILSDDPYLTGVLEDNPHTARVLKVTVGGEYEVVTEGVHTRLTLPSFNSDAVLDILNKLKVHSIDVLFVQGTKSVDYVVEDLKLLSALRLGGVLIVCSPKVECSETFTDQNFSHRNLVEDPTKSLSLFVKR